MADDLDDEWWEKQDSVKNDSGSSDNELEEHVSEDKTSKRKAVEETVDDESKKKKRKRNRKRITDELKDKTPQRGSPDQLINTLNKHFEGKISAVEKDELQLDAEHDFFPCSETDHTPTSYFRTVLPKWNKILKTENKPGHPIVLVISASAIRSVELNRELQDFKTDKCKCAKLFAKHFKLEEQQKFLQKSKCHLGIGTPNRILALMKLDALHLDELKAVVIDYNWRDTKSKRLLDIPDVKTDLFNLLKEFLIPHIQNSKCKIGIL